MEKLRKAKTEVSACCFSPVYSLSIFLLMKVNLLSGSVRSRPGPAICWSAVGPLSESDICRSHCITWRDKHCSRPSGGQKLHSVLIRGFVHFFKGGLKHPYPTAPATACPRLRTAESWTGSRSRQWSLVSLIPENPEGFGAIQRHKHTLSSSIFL